MITFHFPVCGPLLNRMSDTFRQKSSKDFVEACQLQAKTFVQTMVVVCKGVMDNVMSMVGLDVLAVENNGACRHAFTELFEWVEGFVD